MFYTRFFSFFWILCCTALGAETPTKWIVYFSDKADVTQFRPYEWVVLDRFYHPPVRPLRDQGKTVFGYLNLGEEEQYSPWFNDVKKEGLLLIPNEDWPGSYMIDLRNPLWVKRVIEQIIPFILSKGFNGLFLDTLDNAAYLEYLDPEKYKGMKAAAVNMVKAIRLNYPHVAIMMNRGFDLVDEVSPYIDFLLGEVIFTEYNFKNKNYYWNDEAVKQEGIKTMKKAKSINNKIQLLSLDYWNPGDKATIDKIYKEAASYGFNPYVSTIELNEIIPGP